MDERTEQIRAKLQTKEGCWVADSGDVWYLLKRLDESSPPTEQRGELEKLRARINNYLASGGLFNPESMEHQKVRELLLECRDALVSKGR
jgi:hypothetical protein